jgi:hypothetical protein
MSKKNVKKVEEVKYGISKLSHTFDVGYLIDEGVELIKDSVLNGDISLEDALYGLLVSAKSDQWLEDKYPTIHANQTEIDGNRVTFTDLEEFEHLKH